MLSTVRSRLSTRCINCAAKARSCSGISGSRLGSEVMPPILLERFEIDDRYIGIVLPGSRHGAQVAGCGTAASSGAGFTLAKSRGRWRDFHPITPVTAGRARVCCRIQFEFMSVLCRRSRRLYKFHAGNLNRHWKALLREYVLQLTRAAAFGQKRSFSTAQTADFTQAKKSN
jgi:hypothetical protein